MKKNKVIRLSENDLVRIIQRVISEQTSTTTDDKTAFYRNQVTDLKGSEVVMYNESGLNRYEPGEKPRAYETYKINDAWVSYINNNKATLSFSVTRLDGEEVSGKTGVFKGAFTREKKDTNLPIQFRWDCVGHFEKGLGSGNNFKRLGGIKEDYSNPELQTIIQTRPFCDYGMKTQKDEKTGQVTIVPPPPIIKGAAYLKRPR